jgi:hypothetical protein
VCSRPRNVATHRTVPLEIKTHVLITTRHGALHSRGKYETDDEVLSFIRFSFFLLLTYFFFVPNFFLFIGFEVRTAAVM